MILNYFKWTKAHITSRQISEAKFSWWQKTKNSQKWKERKFKDFFF